MKYKLEERYNENIIFTVIPGKSTILTLKETLQSIIVNSQLVVDNQGMMNSF